MKLRLFYWGPIRPRRQVKLPEIQNIRRDIHKQLSVLWECEPLNGHKNFLKFPEDGLCGLFEERQKITFAPLVSKQIDMIASLNILFLRHQAPGQLISEGGDIDNRIKTLFDALRMPSKGEIQTLGNNFGPKRKPFYCLLQDDSLITKISVETDRLLTDSRPNEMLAIIQVNAYPSKATMTNLGLL